VVVLIENVKKGPVREGRIVLDGHVDQTVELGLLRGLDVVRLSTVVCLERGGHAGNGFGLDETVKPCIE
jgi:hypothetical protein